MFVLFPVECGDISGYVISYVCEHYVTNHDTYAFRMNHSYMKYYGITYKIACGVYGLYVDMLIL